MRAILLALPIALAATLPAAASGGFGCSASDKSLRFAAESAMSRGMGGVFLNLKGTLEIKLDGIADDLRRLTLDDALTHSWIDGDEMKLAFYTERQAEPFASVEFVVETTMVEEGTYRGHYTLTVYDTPVADDADSETWTAEGYVTCMVE